MRLPTVFSLLMLLGGVSQAGAAELPGTWTADVNGAAYDLTFDSSGGLSVVADNRAIAIARYEADDGELVITDLGGAEACQGDNAEATYAYELSESQLSLSKVEDPCEKRSDFLDGTTFRPVDSG